MRARYCNYRRTVRLNSILSTFGVMNSAIAIATDPPQLVLFREPRRLPCFVK
ncbi:hypothetical protein BDV26DRAFT_258381 [Aspergillus bertholletiae]|uniref:Uncharacterized protein n=1 Tax=Aspergillus bertholletiae TaxID=1226010 RepID=A0A5N7BDZ4_9EURO|nr:hypothetical protein BDV26DRAFT_258381 [Aspergillus bertholletiae]